MFLGTTCDELHGPEAMEKLSRIRSICEEKERTVSNVKPPRKSKKGRAPVKLVPYDDDCGRGIENQDPKKLRYYQTDPRHCIARLRPDGVCPPEANVKLYPLVCPCVRNNGRQDIEDDYNKSKCIKNFPWYKNGGKQAEKIICYREIAEEKEKHEREMMCLRQCKEKYKRENQACCDEHRNRVQEESNNKCPICCKCIKCCNGL